MILWVFVYDGDYCGSMMPIRLILSLLLALSPTPQCHAARSLQARRVQTRRAVDRYDRSITTFSPEGRLLQLEYALIAAEERVRGLTVCVECDGVVVFAFPSSDEDDNQEFDSYNITDDKTHDVHKSITIDGEVNEDDSTKYDKEIDISSVVRQFQPQISTNNTNEHNPTHNTKIHRLSPTHLLLTSGLAGDARVLASAFQRMAASWTHVQYGEVVTARELSKEMGKVRHAIGLQPGARVLGVVGILIGLDDVDDRTNVDKLGVEVRMYRSLPGGTLDRCNVCCSGGGADANGNAARKDATTSLLDVLSTTNSDIDDNQQQKLQRVIEEVGRVALKYHPDHEDDEIDESNGNAKRVDIWLVRASAADSTEKKDETNQAVINPYRYLGKALMETRYARRVALDQLSTAVQSLIDNNTKKI